MELELTKGMNEEEKIMKLIKSMKSHHSFAHSDSMTPWPPWKHWIKLLKIGNKQLNKVEEWNKLVEIIEACIDKMNELRFCLKQWTQWRQWNQWKHEVYDPTSPWPHASMTSC